MSQVFLNARAPHSHARVPLEPPGEAPPAPTPKGPSEEQIRRAEAIKAAQAARAAKLAELAALREQLLGAVKGDPLRLLLDGRVTEAIEFQSFANARDQLLEALAEVVKQTSAPVPGEARRPF
jgi:hypothetical protein